MAAKQKLVGRIAFAKEQRGSQIYWKCPSRGCTQIHYFSYLINVPGTTALYKHRCIECKKSYSASQVHVTGTVVTLAVVFED